MCCLSHHDLQCLQSLFVKRYGSQCFVKLDIRAHNNTGFVHDKVL